MHDPRVRRYDGSMEQLAEDIGDLRYDVLAKLLDDLASKISGDSDADLKRGRGKLSMCLRNSVVSIRQAKKHIDNAWEICEPYIKK